MPNDWAIVAVYKGDSSYVQITQTISYTNGNSYYQIKWEIKNTGLDTYNNLHFKHGGDTHFSFSNDGKTIGHWNDNNLGMVYVTDEHPQASGILGFYGGIESPASSFYEDEFGLVYTAVMSGQFPLPNDVNDVNDDPNGHDAAYALQWYRTTLYPEEVWTIVAFEKCTEAGYVQVIAPAEQTIEPGQTEIYGFIVQNYQEFQDTFDLLLISDWAVNLPDSITVNAGSLATVNVEVTAPIEAEDGTSNTITLTATSQNPPNIENSDSTAIVVESPNDAPVFTSTPVTSATEETLYTYNIVATDDDAGDSLSITGTKPSWLSLTDNGDGTATLTGTPANGDVGDNAVELVVTDAAGLTDTQSFTINVINTNDAPLANDGALTTNEDTAASGTLIASDIDQDSLTYSIVNNGGKGTATITNVSTGAYTYTPDDNVNGTDTFTFKVNDGTVDSNTATVTVTINAANDAPVASADTATTSEDTPVDITLSASDIDGDTL